jgi:hypothetical protein
MGGDYTKFTFKPQKDYAGVFKQQGRVDLDADWNELVQIFDRRWRAETIDVMGRAVVPNSTPDAFKITPTGPGAFTIGLGRMYVDGLLAENHGVDPENRFDPVLGETFSQTEVAYNDQPYLPAPLPPPLAGTAGTTDLIYLDVWQREVTCIEDPAIKEIALEGPDTATRIQTAWQVRALQNAGSHQCGDDVSAWDNLIAPSAGQLTTSVLAPPPSSDPCIISASGGYRGLENRLYRVEVHTAGGLGTAKFKWSRDDASITTSVTAISGTGPYQITVQRIGRDQVLRFQIGDWVEVLDDYTEFQDQAGQMGSVTNIDEANQILTVAFSSAAALGGFDPTNAKRHPRIRCWDEKIGVDSNGLLTVAAGPIDLEDGIQVTFSLDPNITSNTFKVGDYWLFAARTTDGSIEILNQAPPRGILHHYCRLGFLTWPGTFSDCRQHWPPAECDCCTVTVGDGVDSHGQFTDIQQAIDALGASGGLVCIGRGVYVVTQTIHLSSVKSKVIIRGMGPATRIIFAPDSSKANFMQIEGAEYVRIEDLFVAGATESTLINFLNTSSCAVDKCILVNVGTKEQVALNSPAAIATNDECKRLTIHESLLIALVGTSLASVSDLTFRDNTVLAPQTGILIESGDNLEIIHNQLRGIAPKDWAKLQSDGVALTNAGPSGVRNAVTAFQAEVSSLLDNTGMDTLGLAGVIIHSGRLVKLERNLIGARVGFTSFLLVEAGLVENEILSYIAVIFFVGLLVRLRDNLIGGLLIGLLQPGISFGLQCDGNAWLGFDGIVLAAPADLEGSAMTLLDAIFPGISGLITNAVTLSGIPTAIGLTITAKFSENIFASFLYGIYKSETNLSSDVDVLHNSFFICSAIGIMLGEGLSFRGKLGNVNATTMSAPFPLIPHHLIEGNTLVVEGQGIFTAVEGTNVCSNTIECGNTAITIESLLCKVTGNTMICTAQQSNPPAALLLVEPGSNFLQISGNELVGGPGHGILMGDVSDVTIDGNLLAAFQGNGITTLLNTTQITRLRMAHNSITACRGDASSPQIRPPGVVVLGQTFDSSITGNTINDNLAESPGTAIFCSLFSGSEILGNMIQNNGDVETTTAFQGAIWLSAVAGQIKIQGNTVSGNGGRALSGLGQTSVPQSNPANVLVQNNVLTVSATNTPSFFIVLESLQSLQFQGNNCTDPDASTVFPSSGTVVTHGLPFVILRAQNTVMMSDNEMQSGIIFIGEQTAQTLINANVFFATVSIIGLRGIVTSNLALFSFGSRPGFVIANNLP